MGCNCGKGGTTVKWVYTSPAGARTVYTSEIQAKAAVIRNKGGTYAPAK